MEYANKKETKNYIYVMQPLYICTKDSDKFYLAEYYICMCMCM